MSDTTVSHAEPSTPESSPVNGSAPVASPATVLESPPELPQVKDSPGRRRKYANAEEAEAAKRAQKAAYKARQRAQLSSVSPGPAMTQGASNAGAGAPSTIAAPVTIVADYRLMGQQSAQLFFGAGVMVFGADWLPNEQEGEHAVVAGAFADFYRAKNVARLDPTFVLSMTLLSYGLARLQKPTVRGKLATAWAWTKSRFGGWRRRSPGETLQ